MLEYLNIEFVLSSHENRKKRIAKYIVIASKKHLNNL